MTQQDIDTRTDVYSLGVMLYELLVGALPFDPRELRRAGFDEIRRRIREVEPSKPSTRITTSGDASSDSARKRRTDPTGLARQLRGDLDWITMTALAKDRARRYASASELAADISRYLDGDPVKAGPPTATYRLGKLLRKYRSYAVAALAVVVALTLGLVAASVMYMRARSAAAIAVQARNEAESERAEAVWQGWRRATRACGVGSGSTSI